MTPTPSILDSLLSGISENVVGGWEVTPNAFPYQVHISYTDTRSQTLQCGGVILNTFYILTAAHCVLGKELGTLKVVAGDHDRRFSEGMEQERQIQFAILHKDYKPFTTKDSDLAVVKVKEGFEFNENVTSIPFPRRRMKFKGLTVKTGWGQTGDSDTSISQRLMYVVLPLLSRLDCIQAFNGTDVVVNDKMICAGVPLRGTCHGDSGGPLVCRIRETGQPILCGITTHARLCGKSEYPGLNADVSYFGEWIQDALDGRIRPNMYSEAEPNQSVDRDREYINIILGGITTTTTATTPTTTRSTTTTTTTTMPRAPSTTITQIPTNLVLLEDTNCTNVTFPCNDTQDSLDLDLDPLNFTLPTIPTPTVPLTFQCDQNDTEIPFYSVCDGVKDCPDFSDEVNCTKSTHTLFQCLSSGKYIWTSNKCNKFPDCEDHSDELNCTVFSYIFRCDSGMTIRASYRCDMDDDCKDTSDSDEIGCSFKCRDGNITKTRYRCNGVNNCGDWSDELDPESGLNCTNNLGNPTAFLCSDGTIISSSGRCDLEPDCPDQSDETNCTLFTKFRCANGRRVKAGDKCDNVDDCGDWSDEWGCTGPDGTPTVFNCTNGKTVRTLRDKCNYINNCGDWSDEFGCLKADGTPTVFNCTNSGITKSYSSKCNGLNDCGDWEDEVGCLRSDGNLTLFHCTNGNLTGFLNKCDGINDCGDWSDEFGCSRRTVFFCANKNIINFLKKCDNNDDCEDNSDEINCHEKGMLNSKGRLKPCKKYEFTCNQATTPARRCISYDHRCDGRYQCPRGEDEAGCDEGTTTGGSCGPGRISCTLRPPYKGTCPPKVFLCDGTEQCLNGKDEQNCSRFHAFITTTATTTTLRPLHPNHNLPCPRGEYRCQHENLCIPFDYFCDGDVDCLGGDDETKCDRTTPRPKYNPIKKRNCSEWEYTCPSGGNCIPLFWLCDGSPDCVDLEDESNCTTPTPRTTAPPLLTMSPRQRAKSLSCLENEFSCPGAPCIPSRYLCDGDVDCPGGEDETNCVQLY